MNQAFKSLLITTALSIGLGTLAGAQAQTSNHDANTVLRDTSSTISKKVDLAVREVRVMGPTGAPVVNNSKVPKGAPLQVMATLVNLGSAPTPGCKVRMSNTGDPNIQTALVPSLPVGGSCSVSFPTPTVANGATTTATIKVEANFDAGLSPYGRWFPEVNYPNNFGTVNYFVI